MKRIRICNFAWITSSPCKPRNGLKPEQMSALVMAERRIERDFGENQNHSRKSSRSLEDRRKPIIKTISWADLA